MAIICEYNVDGMLVQAESVRHAVKYYNAVVRRVPTVVVPVDVIPLGSLPVEVLAICEHTGLGVFASDEEGKDYTCGGDDCVYQLCDHVLKQLKREGAPL